MSEEDTRPMLVADPYFVERLISIIEDRRFALKEQKKRTQWDIRMPTPSQ